jgi:Flp pilus assembly protein TadG
MLMHRLSSRLSLQGRPGLPKFLAAQLFSERGRARSGVASIEFALVAPMLFLMVSGMFDTSKALIIEHQVDDCARFIAISATTASVQTDKTTSLSAASAQQAMSLIYAFMPWVRSGIEHGKRSVTLTSVAFVPITSGCTVTTSNNCYNAEVAFSVSYGGGGQTSVTPFTVITRSCGTLTQITPSAQLKNGQTQLTVLRTASVAKPDALMIADVHYQYTPFFLKFLTGPIDFWKTAKWSARSGSTSQSSSQTLQYTTYTGTDGTGNCTVS